MLNAYRQHARERANSGIPPLPLSRQQTEELIELLRDPPPGEEQALVELLTFRVSAGVDAAASIKAGYLAALAFGRETSVLVGRERAVHLLGTMLGGYNVQPLVEMLADEAVGALAATALKKTLLVFDAFRDVRTMADRGNSHAASVLQSWAEAEWFTSRPELPQNLMLTIFKVPGEINTDDLSPGSDAWSRPDIPLHALAMFKNARPGIFPDEDGRRGPTRQIEALKVKGYPIAFVGDVIGTGSSRKSATNSLLWFMGQDIPFIPNKRFGGVCLGSKIAPIFYNTMEDAGALPIELDVSALETGDVVELQPYQGKVLKGGQVIIEFSMKSEVVFDEVRAGGRIPLIVGRGLTEMARDALGLGRSTIFRVPPAPPPSTRGYTLAQKMVGRACGLPSGQGVRPGAYCEPRMTSIGSPDSTGPMTRDELNDLACLRFSADLVMQSFCHTVAYPKPVDKQVQRDLPGFVETRGGVSLRPGDGIIHSWLNRMLLPDTVGTGGDSHTRFPIGISFPAGSGLVAFAAATGLMPLDMPESVLVRFKGELRPGITLRDIVHAIPLYARRAGLLTIEKTGKTNVFSGRILEIEGLPKLKIEQAFELANASAERSASACTVQLESEPVVEYIRSNVALLKWMIAEDYCDPDAIRRRINAMEKWLADPQLLSRDADADYAAIIDIDLADINEPIVARPNDPDDVNFLSDVAGTHIDEVFIGSCMTNIGHFRAASRVLKDNKDVPVKLWISAATKMDEQKLSEEGHFGALAAAGARTEMPGCSLCMGNQARVADGATVFSTSTRNFPHRLGKNANVYLGSSELAAVCSKLGRIPTKLEYMEHTSLLNAERERIYQYMNFDKLDAYATPSTS
jgi:aconitate hydratase 2/2-methylisocitrate dehydratase